MSTAPDIQVNSVKLLRVHAASSRLVKVTFAVDVPTGFSVDVGVELAERLAGVLDAALGRAAPIVSINDDWRGPPSADEVRAHHEAHHDIYGASVWHMVARGAVFAVAVKARDGALHYLPEESTKWRPADALYTPVAWSTPRGAL